MESVKVAVAPVAAEEWLLEAIEGAGGVLSPLEEASALIWQSHAAHSPFGGLGDAIADAGQLKWVQLTSAGNEALFRQEIYRNDLIWTSAKGVYGENCAEMALALLLISTRRLGRYLSADHWLGDISHGGESKTLYGARVGIIGAGGIGQALLRLLQPFRSEVTMFRATSVPVEGAARTLSINDLRDVAGEFDALTITVPLTPKTSHMINEQILRAMRDDAWLVNVSRGEVIDTSALIAALQSGQIGGAALDVTDPEPLPDGHVLWTLPNCVITPHVASPIVISLDGLADRVRENVQRFAESKPLVGLIDESAQY